MKRILSSLILVVLVAAMGCAQSVSNEARKLETIPNTHADNEQAYLDLMAKALGDNPGARGFLVAYRKSTLPPGLFLRRVYGYRDYLVNMRGIELSRVEIIEGDIKDETFTEMWLVPAGAKPPTADSQLNLVPESPLIFDVVYPDCPSEMSVYLEGLNDSLRFYARGLLANPNGSAKIVAYPGRRSTVRKVARIARHARAALIANYHIDGTQITAVAKNQRRTCSQIELWITKRR